MQIVERIRSVRKEPETKRDHFANWGLCITAAACHHLGSKKTRVLAGYVPASGTPRRFHKARLAAQLRREVGVAAT